MPASSYKASAYVIYLVRHALGAQNDDKCGVLIMDQTGAVGLDLSFASWVFLLEPLEDISIHQQVVSRAHRMGAKQPVHLETLVMKVMYFFQVPGNPNSLPCNHCAMHMPLLNAARERVSNVL